MRQYRDKVSNIRDRCRLYPLLLIREESSIKLYWYLRFFFDIKTRRDSRYWEHWSTQRTSLDLQYGYFNNVSITKDTPYSKSSGPWELERITQEWTQEFDSGPPVYLIETCDISNKVPNGVLRSLLLTDYDETTVWETHPTTVYNWHYQNMWTCKSTRSLLSHFHNVCVSILRRTSFLV